MSTTQLPVIHPLKVLLPAFLIRFILIALLLSLVMFRYGNQLAELLLPVFKAEISWLDDTYRIDQLFIDRQGADAVIRLRVGQARYIVLNGRTFYPDSRGKANASTLVGNVTLPAVLMISLALAWPVRKLGHIFLCCLLLLPCLLMLWLIDVPMVLWASIWSIHVEKFAPDEFSPLLIWSEFMQAGGRLALAGAFGCMIGALLSGSLSEKAINKNQTPA